MQKELKTLYKVLKQSNGKFIVISQKADPSYGYAFGALQSEEELGEFDRKEEALVYIFSLSQFNRFVITDLNSKEVYSCK